MATVLVTGGGGVVGLHLVRELATSGYRVTNISRGGRPAIADSVLRGVARDVEYLACDVRDFESLMSIAEPRGVEGIFHTAALTGEGQARALPHETLSTNLYGTCNVLEAGRRLAVRRIVYTGSPAEYGLRSDLRPIREDEINVDGLYGETKYVGHRLGERYRQVFGLEFVTCRVNSAYGPGTRFNPHRGLVGNTLLAHLCRAVARREPVRLESGADYPRAWTYAADTALGLRLAYEKDVPAYSAYNIGSGTSYIVREVVETIRRIDPRADIAVGDGRWEDEPLQIGALRGPADITRAREDLGFAPRYSLEDGLREFIDWWRRSDVAT